MASKLILGCDFLQSHNNTEGVTTKSKSIMQATSPKPNSESGNLRSDVIVQEHRSGIESVSRSVVEDHDSDVESVTSLIWDDLRCLSTIQEEECSVLLSSGEEFDLLSDSETHTVDDADKEGAVVTSSCANLNKSSATISTLSLSSSSDSLEWPPSYDQNDSQSTFSEKWVRADVVIPLNDACGKKLNKTANAKKSARKSEKQRREFEEKQSLLRQIEAQMQQLEDSLTKLDAQFENQ